MTVVFTDNFTVGSNTNIDAYPSGSPDYQYNNGSGTNLTVNSAAGNVQCIASVDCMARISDGAVPTGDQEITASCTCPTASNNSNGYVGVRAGAAGVFTWYYVFTDINTANETQFYRVNAGSFTLLASADLVNGTGARTIRIRATGTSTVVLTWQINATAEQSYNDSSASRLTSGPPCVGGYYNGAGSSPSVDNVSVDDLASSATSVVPHYSSVPLALLAR